MQPLISPVDHESRHNSYRSEEAPRPSEHTPLLHRFPLPAARQPASPYATAVITLLLVILISGVIIGIYLLIVQNNSENILPPVGIPLQLVSLSQWNPNQSRNVTASAVRAHQVAVVQTDSRNCHSARDCTLLLNAMQTNLPEGLPYNFLVSATGQTFEALGWRMPSPLFSELPTALVLAFIVSYHVTSDGLDSKSKLPHFQLIAASDAEPCVEVPHDNVVMGHGGNFTETPPTKAHLDEARDFFAESVSLQKLDPIYSIIGKSTKYTPRYLFQALSTLPQWDRKLSDG